MAELGGDESATEHDEMLRPVRRSLDRVAGLVRHLVDAVDVGDERPCARGEHDPISGDRVTADLQRALADEVGVAFVDRHVRQAQSILQTAFGDRVDPAKHPLHDGGPVRRLEPGGHSVLRRVVVGSRLGHICGIDQHLRGDAAAIQARPTERPAFDDRDFPAVHLVVDHRVTGARSDDDQVVVFRRHRISLAARAGRIAV